MTDATTDPTLAEIARNDQRQARQLDVFTVTLMVGNHYKHLTSEGIGMAPDAAAELCEYLQGQLMMQMLHPNASLSVMLGGPE